MNIRHTWLLSIIIVAGFSVTSAIGQEIVGCDEINWKERVLLEFDEVEEACQDIVIRDGARYVRFEVVFRSAMANGDVHVAVRLRDGTRVVRNFPAPSNILISSRDGEFLYAVRDLEWGDALDVYVPINLVVASAPAR